MRLGSFRSFNVLLEDKVQWLKDNVKDIDTSHDDLAQHREPHDVIDHFAAHDPHPKKAYTQWMVNQYQKKNIRQEDAPSVGSTLSNFDRYKGKLEKKDINQYKHPQDLAQAVHPFLGQAASRKEEKKGMGALIHEEEGLKVFKVRNEEEATHFSKEACRHTGVAGTHSDGTASWCTVAPSMFKNYAGEDNSKPLYVVHAESDKKLHTRYQMHFESKQFADARDHNVGLDEMVKRHPGLKNVEDFKGKHPMFDSKEERIQMALSGHRYPDGMTGLWHDAHSPKPVLTSDHISQIYHAGKGESHVINNAATHPNSPTHVIDDIAKTGSTNERSLAAKHPNLGEGGFRSLLGEPAPEASSKTPMRAAVDSYYHNAIRMSLAGNPGLKTHQVEALRTEGGDSHELHERLAQRPAASRDALHHYVSGENHVAATAALHNPNAHPDTFEHAYKNPRLHGAIASSPHAPEHILQRFVADKNTGAAADHPGKHPYVVETHGDIAEKNLKNRTKR